MLELSKTANNLSSDQKKALKILQGSENVFLTGAAGSGKSFLLQHFLKGTDIPILASTGSAAILVGGRTFHSFFGLGIMEGGVSATVDRALKNRRLAQRLKKVKTIVIDEVSMLSGPTLRTAELIARKVRDNESCWGGIRVIAVGDFLQLPPVNPFSQKKEWAFLDPVWIDSDFQNVVLSEVMRTKDQEFLRVLNSIREGQVTSEAREFLDQHVQADTESELTRLFPHRVTVEQYNLKRLEDIHSEARLYQTEYKGKSEQIESFRKHSPVPDQIVLKKGALIMLRQNDIEGQWVNGSLGRIEKLSDEVLNIKLLTGRKVDVEKATFTLLDADGTPVVEACNFPVSLAWAMTIHKAQGATLDRVFIDLTYVWESGQAYVALSRVRESRGLYLKGWSERAIFADPQVTAYYRSLM